MNLEGMQLVAGVGRDKTPDLELLGEITKLNIELEKKQRELEDAYARLEQLAVTDQVTGLYNRHHFFTVVQHFLEESRRYGLPLTCLMLDLDYFKSVNDHYGHIFGDYVLKMVAERFRNNTRKSDLLARYGGEEFVLVAPSTDIRTAGVLGERIRAAVEREPFTLGNVTANVTISAGISGTELITTGPFDHLLDSSDQALYIAKHEGRNRVVIYSPESGVTATQQ
jgi:diguanylate cyclase (GGDEF)-like protein